MMENKEIKDIYEEISNDFFSGEGKEIAENAKDVTKDLLKKLAKLEYKRRTAKSEEEINSLAVLARLYRESLKDEAIAVRDQSREFAIEKIKKYSLKIAEKVGLKLLAL